jgi:hypothetical protein
VPITYINPSEDKISNGGAKKYNMVEMLISVNLEKP